MTKEEVIITAVQWWSDKLAARAPHDNGDKSTSSVMACIFADIGTAPVTKEQLTIFEKELSSRLDIAYEKYVNIQRGGACYPLGCDYGPDFELGESAKAAGISYLNFPFKTNMLVYRDHVMVSDGYARPYVKI